MRLCVDVVWRLWCSSVVLPVDMYIKSISRGLYQYILSYWHHTFSDLPLEIHRVADDRRTVNTSTVHTFQLGAENAWQILLCWFIVMIWDPVWNNVHWNECHFGSIYHDPTILKTVSIASQWVNTDWLKSCFNEIHVQRKGIFPAPMWLN